MTCTTTTIITFSRPFSLTGVERIQPPGTYTIETDEELIQELSFLAHRRVATRMILRDPARPGCVESVDVNPAELAAALVSDETMADKLQAVAPKRIRT